MIIKGLQPLTLLDYPGRPSAIVFLFGCNLRCGYCQNPGLVLHSRAQAKTYTEEELFSFLSSRKNKLEGVVITGGEPCVNKDLPELVRKIKQMGFFVKLDTNGCFPDKLRALLAEGIIDYVAMDVKAPLSKYSEVAGMPLDVGKIMESISLIKGSGIDYEFRTTVVPWLIQEEDLIEIGGMIKFAKAYYIQQFENKINLDPSFSQRQPYPRDFFMRMKGKLAPFTKKVGIRGVL